MADLTKTEIKKKLENQSRKEVKEVLIHMLEKIADLEDKIQQLEER